MNKSLRNRLLVIFGVILACIYFTFPLQKHINLGLDLKGGMHLVLQVDTSKLSENAKKDAVLRAIEILRNRIDSMGVGETVISQRGENEILVQLPGITDRERALAMIGRVAKLEFRLVDENQEDMAAALKGTIPDGYILKHLKKDNEPILVTKKVVLDGERVKDARVDFQRLNQQPYISMTFDGEGSRLFGEITKENVKKRLAIMLDGEVYSAPVINEPILTGNAQITGQFTFNEASILALALRSGALPAPMHVEEERTIGPLLGQDSIDAGIQATILGGVLVIVFMLAYYLMAGFISCLALILNLFCIFGLMGFLNAMLPSSQLVLTLPGIAGIILTLGMAVDANVLINERIREELDDGQNVQSAIKNGFGKALKAIVDSNTTTLIAAFMLFQFGSGPIKGFAVTLSVGLLCSLFTALFVSRTIFTLFYNIHLLKTIPMLRIFKKAKFDFISKRYFFFSVSMIMVALSIVLFFQKKNSAYGIDFAGGQIQEYEFKKPVQVDKLRTILNTLGLKDAVIQQFQKHPTNVLIRTSEDSYETVQKAFKENFADNAFNLLRVEKVGPVVGKALRRAAILAIVFALGGILVYVGFRFRHFDFATAGVIALLHDVTVTLGVILLAGRQIDLLLITALLTIAGYSINDTIIIYDRIRENLVQMRKAPLAEIINVSINQTLSRTILTTSTTLLVVISLYFKGGEVLNTFALALLVGFIAGTYSTIFIASPLVLAWEKNKKKS